MHRTCYYWSEYKDHGSLLNVLWVLSLRFFSTRHDWYQTESTKLNVPSTKYWVFFNKDLKRTFFWACYGLLKRPLTNKTTNSPLVLKILYPKTWIFEFFIPWHILFPTNSWLWWWERQECLEGFSVKST